MKKIFTKQFILTCVSVLLILTVIIIACKKQEEFSVNKSKLMSFYDAKLVEDFRNEPVAKEFINEINKTPIKVVNGILSFNSVDDLDRVYDLIVDYTDKFDALTSNNANYSKYAESEQMPANIMSLLFESKMNFYSLRTEIEEQLVTLERGDGISDDNDPDDHYTVSPYMRTLLTPQCELIINDLICVYYDTYGIGIMNYDWATLKKLHDYQNHHNFDEIKALEFCSGNPEAFFLTTGYEPTLHVDFGYTVDPKNPYTVQFINYSCSEAYKDMEYLWNFGDGTTSTERNPKHTFDSKAKGGTTLCVSVNLSATKGSKAPLTDCITIPSPPSNNPYIAYTESSNGWVSFTCTATNPNNAVKYSWNFGDGQTQPNGINIASCKYSANGPYLVKCTVTYSNTTTEIAQKDIYVTTISSSNGCCLNSNDREVEKEKCPYTYNGENRRVKQVARITNCFGFHRIVGRTICQYKKKNNTWVARKAELINAGAEGIVYRQNGNCGGGCECPETVDLWKGGTNATDGATANAARATMDEGSGGYAIAVGKKSVWARHYVKDGTERINGRGDAAIHDDTCN
jgi:PKD repeat protein